MMTDSVNFPAHYQSANGVECIEAIKAAMAFDEFIGYLRGNCIKYLWRYRQKNGAEDLRKARWYLCRLILEFETNAPTKPQRAVCESGGITECSSMVRTHE